MGCSSILESLALLLTVHQSTLIHHPPSLSTINPIYRTYLTLMAKFHGREHFNEMDYLVMTQAENIIKFCNSITTEPVPSIEKWLPQLLTQFSITLPSDLKPEQIGKPLIGSAQTIQVQQAIVAASSVTAQTSSAPTPADKTVVAALQKEVAGLKQQVQTLRQTVGSSAISTGSSTIEVAAGDQALVLVYAQKPTEQDSQQNASYARLDDQVGALSTELIALQERLRIQDAEIQYLRQTRRPNPPPSNDLCVFL